MGGGGVETEVVPGQGFHLHGNIKGKASESGLKREVALGESFHSHGNIKGKASERVVPKEEWPSVRVFTYMEI